MRFGGNHINGKGVFLLDAKKRVVIDAGHGGETDSGAVYYGRQEKDDALKMALAVGNILEENGVEVVFTRVSDVYDTPFEKAEMANNAEADFFVSIHRNAMDVPGSASGTMSLVYSNEGILNELAQSINQELARTGFKDLGIVERPGLVVLRKTEMPAVLVEVGFIDNPEDNRRFDEQFEEIAGAIAAGILNVVQKEEPDEGGLYVIQTGAYRVRSLAEQQLVQLQSEGYPAYLVAENNYYYVRVGAFRELDNAVNMEKELRRAGYSTIMLRR